MLDLLPSFGAITWWRSVPSIRYAGSGNSVQGIGCTISIVHSTGHLGLFLSAYVGHYGCLSPSHPTQKSD